MSAETWGCAGAGGQLQFEVKLLSLKHVHGVLYEWILFGICLSDGNLHFTLSSSNLIPCNCADIAVREF